MEKRGFCQENSKNHTKIIEFDIKISIVTVCLNCEKTIRRTIESVLYQSYHNIEYIIVDGCSVDGTLEIIKEFEPLFSGRLKYISEEDKGLYDAMNKGIKISAGDIVAFLNGDDWYEEDALNQVAWHFNNSSCDILFGNANIIEGDKVVGLRKSDVEKIQYTMPCCHQAVFAKRGLFEKVGLFDLKYLVCADYDWLLRAYNSEINIETTEAILASFRTGGLSSQQMEQLITEHIAIAVLNAQKQGISEIIPEIYREMLNLKEEDLYQIGCNHQWNFMDGILSRHRSYYIWGTGFYAKKCFRLFRLLNLTIKGFVDNYRTKKYIEGYEVITPEQLGEEGLICIATVEYEGDIIKQLEQMNIPLERYFRFSSLRSEMIAYEWEGILSRVKRTIIKSCFCR